MPPKKKTVKIAIPNEDAPVTAQEVDSSVVVVEETTLPEDGFKTSTLVHEDNETVVENRENDNNDSASSANLLEITTIGVVSAPKPEENEEENNDEIPLEQANNSDDDDDEEEHFILDYEDEDDQDYNPAAGASFDNDEQEEEDQHQQQQQVEEQLVSSAEATTEQQQQQDAAVVGSSNEVKPASPGVAVKKPVSTEAKSRSGALRMGKNVMWRKDFVILALASVFDKHYHETGAVLMKIAQVNNEVKKWVSHVQEKYQVTPTTDGFMSNAELGKILATLQIEAFVDVSFNILAPKQCFAEAAIEFKEELDKEIATVNPTRHFDKSPLLKHLLSINPWRCEFVKPYPGFVRDIPRAELGFVTATLPKFIAALRGVCTRNHRPDPSKPISLTILPGPATKEELPHLNDDQHNALRSLLLDIQDFLRSRGGNPHKRKAEANNKLCPRDELLAHLRRLKWSNNGLDLLIPHLQFRDDIRFLQSDMNNNVFVGVTGEYTLFEAAQKPLCEINSTASHAAFYIDVLRVLAHSFRLQTKLYRDLYELGWKNRDIRALLLDNLIFDQKFGLYRCGLDLFVFDREKFNPKHAPVSPNVPRDKCFYVDTQNEAFRNRIIESRKLEEEKILAASGLNTITQNRAPASTASVNNNNNNNGNNIVMMPAFLTQDIFFSHIFDQRVKRFLEDLVRVGPLRDKEQKLILADVYTKMAQVGWNDNEIRGKCVESLMKLGIIKRISIARRAKSLDPKTLVIFFNPLLPRHTDQIINPRGNIGPQQQQQASPPQQQQQQNNNIHNQQTQRNVAHHYHQLPTAFQQQQQQQQIPPPPRPQTGYQQSDPFFRGTAAMNNNSNDNNNNNNNNRNYSQLQQQQQPPVRMNVISFPTAQSIKDDPRYQRLSPGTRFFCDALLQYIPLDGSKKKKSLLISQLAQLGWTNPEEYSLYLRDLKKCELIGECLIQDGSNDLEHIFLIITPNNSAPSLQQQQQQYHQLPPLPQQHQHNHNNNSSSGNNNDMLAMLDRRRARYNDEFNNSNNVPQHQQHQQQQQQQPRQQQNKNVGGNNNNNNSGYYHLL